MNKLNSVQDKSLAERECELSMKSAMNLYSEFCNKIQDSFPIVEMQENGICCMVFKGDYIDQDVIEEYLRTRPFGDKTC